MQLRYSEYFKLDKKEFDNLGVFNGFILHDSKYFLNPKLIKETDNEFFSSSYNKISTRFSNIISLIDKVHVPDKKQDKFYEAAINTIKSKENGYIGLGYSEAGKAGRGIGEKIATDITYLCYQLIKVDKIEPELFELLGVFKEQIDFDRISDMIIKIILEDILKYTEHIANILNLPVCNHKNYKKYKLPYNTFDNDSPLFFLPTSILSKLPSWDKIFNDTIAEDKEIKEALHSLFGEEYKVFLQKKKYREELILKNKIVITKLIEKYKLTEDEAYDFINDPSNDFNWIDKVKELVDTYPLLLNSNSSVYSIVETICNKFQELIENTNANKLFYDDKEIKKKEKTSQQAFQLFAQSYCTANNLDISAEPNGGQGAVDFKFSKGTEKVLVELKLSSSSIGTLKHCLETQIEVYKKSEGTDKAFFLILMVGKDIVSAEKRIEKLIEYKNELGKKEKYLSEIIYVDAFLKPSASKA